MPTTHTNAAVKRAETRAFNVAAKLGEIQKQSESEPPETWAPKVIAALGGDSNTFIMLDERPLYFGERSCAFHRCLRQVRNSPVWGPSMFASFKR